MAWTVPNGCYYAFPYYTSMNPYVLAWVYYNAGQTVPTEQSPNYASQPNYDTNPFILIDFTNGYIYTHISSVTININANNTFTAVSNYEQIHSGTARVIASHDSLQVVGVTLTGEPFTFGDGTGLFDKDVLLSGREYQPYVMSYAFYNRTDITSVTLPDDVDSFSNAFEGCSNLTAVTGTARIGVRPGKILGSAEAMFKNCSSLITPPTFDVSDTSANVNFNSCFYGCTSLVNAPALITNIKYMDDCFNGCTSLTQAITVPTSVTSMRRCFSGCVSLAGAVTINATSASTTDMFYGTVNEIVLFGDSPQLKTIASSYANVYVWSLSTTMTAQRDETTQTTVNVAVDVTRFTSGNLTSLVLSKDGTTQSVTWNDPTLDVTSTPTTFTTTLTGISESDTLTLTVVATDQYGSATAVSVKIPIAFYTIDVRAGGKEIAFGAPANDDLTNYPNGLFKCDMDIIAERGVSITGDLMLGAVNVGTTLDNKQDTLTTETWSPSITRSTGGTISNITGKQYGKLCMVSFVITYNTSVGAGNNLFTGTLSNNKPVVSAFGAGYYGSHDIITQISYAGNITVRNASASAVTVSDGVTCTVLYLTT